jgi:hypothetical protein
MRYYGVQNEVKAYCNRLQSETSITVTPSLVKTLNDRVESLKKSGVWSQFGLGFNDNDGDSYLQRANVTDILGRSEVLWFVRGMKSLGLWQNMVCWPLRSYQNAGTGSTVYSLGGFGIYNATSFNSPSWGIDGITFGNVSYLLVSSFPNSNYLFNSTIFKFDTIDGTTQNVLNFLSNNRFSLAPAETVNLGRLFRSTNNLSTIDDYRFSFSLTIGTHYLYSAYIDGINKVARLNKGTSTATKSFATDIFSSTASNFTIGAGSTAGANSVKGSIAFTCLVNLTYNQPLKELFAFENLYSQTLGSKLVGLP